MKTFTLPALFLLVCPTLFAAQRCEDLAKLQLPQTEITLAVSEPADASLTLDEVAKPANGLPAFCRVAATLRPSNDSAIRVELWLPEPEAWNHRFLGTGNGGFAGHLSYGGLVSHIKSGYAVANTDMGTQVGKGQTAAIFVDRPERWADWGYRATHQMTVFSKQILALYYGQPATHNYFSGCSTGGQQGWMEAERYPADYDGIVAGAPANNRVPLHIGILWGYTTLQKTPLPAEKLKLLSDAVLDACDAADGVKDGLISDPERCSFNPARLQCAKDDAPTCLTRDQVDAVRKLYSGPVNPTTGANIYAGLPLSSEYAWGRIAGNPAHAPYGEIFQWAFGKDWKWQSFDYDKDVAAIEQKLNATLNAASPQLTSFSQLGHKLLVYHGWSDTIVMPGESVRFHNEILAGDPKADNYYRLFMVPGMEHCSGGRGPDRFDALGAMVSWVEDGIAPDLIPAHNATISRPLCVYPRIALYDGKGDPSQAASFYCGLPTKSPAVTTKTPALPTKTNDHP